MKRKWGFMIFLVLVLSLAGCGKKKKEIVQEETDYIGDITENTLTFHADGTIDQVICEDLRDTEEASGAEQFVRNEIDTYNGSVGVSKVSLLQYETEGTKGKAAIRYSDMESYRGFNLVNISLQDFDRAAVDQLAASQLPKEEQDEFTEADLASVSDAELAEAGIDPEEFRSGKYKETKEEQEQITATFTDASGKLVESKDVTEGKMMVVTEEETILTFESGVVYYTNSHGKILDRDSVKADGKGPCVVIFVFNY